MIVQQIELTCRTKQQELIEKYFGNLVHEAAIEMPETIGEYIPELPLKVEAEYYKYLKALWQEIAPVEAMPFEVMLDRPDIREKITEDDREGLKYAYEDATHITLWERITKSNHKDVIYYKGLLQVYAEELLNHMRIDFMEDVEKLKL